MEQILLSIAMGLGLSAACGFRVFVPMLIVSLAARSGHLTLNDQWMWLASDPALIVFCTATVLEICAYYIPVIDHVLDVASAPVAVIAGTIVAAALFTDISPFMRWTLAIIAGGGAASVTHVAKAAARTMVSIPTFGTGNWLVTTGEIVTATAMSLLSIILPIIGVLLLIVAGIVTFILYRRHRIHKNTMEPIAA